MVVAQQLYEGEESWQRIGRIRSHYHARTDSVNCRPKRFLIPKKWLANSTAADITGRTTSVQDQVEEYQEATKLFVRPEVSRALRHSLAFGWTTMKLYRTHLGTARWQRSNVAERAWRISMQGQVSLTFRATGQTVTSMTPARTESKDEDQMEKIRHPEKGWRKFFASSL